MFNKSSEKLCLQWNKFSLNTRSSFEELRNDTDFTDVTLACEDGELVEAHKVILVTSSPFFSRLLKKNNNKNQSHPLIYMRGIKYDILMAMTDFIYCGETNVYQDDLESFLALAADLQLKGLEEGLKEIPKTDPIKDSEVESPTPLKTMKPMQKAKPRKVNVTEPANDHKSQELGLSEQRNFGTDLDDLDAKVRSVMTSSENSLCGKNGKIGKARICTICGKEGHVSSIMNHIETVHMSGLSIPCDICGKTVKSRQSLSIHRGRYHTKDGENVINRAVENKFVFSSN